MIKNKIYSYSMDETWEDVLKDLLEDWKYKAFKCKEKIIISLPTYPPADSVGRQCQRNNILRVALVEETRVPEENHRPVASH